MTTTIELDPTAFHDFLQQRDEPQWLTDQRTRYWEGFQAAAWPTRREEEWLRTDIRLFHPDRYSLPGAAADASRLETRPAAVLSEGVELAGSVVSVNSRAVASSIDPQWTARGVVFGSLDQLVQEHGDLIQPHLLQRGVAADYDRFARWHAACWSGGCFLYVPRGVVVPQPFHLQSLVSAGGCDFGHVLVILEDGAEATLMTESASDTPGGEGLHCGGVELVVGRGAHLRYVALQDWGQRVWNFAHQSAAVDTDATLQWTIAALGSRLSKVNQQVQLVGPGASSQVNGVLFTEGTQHLAYHTLQHHEAPSCRSDFLYKAALQDRSRTVWRGMIKVDAAAQKTDGYQRNDNLLLSERARADSIPGLEIEADDVRCTHGSTSGKVDEELIFYAQCRGYTRREAVRMIVSGFFQQIFDRITIESVREALGLAISRRVRDYE